MMSYPDGYSETLVQAVKWLIMCGITRSGEIAKRLEVSPFTVRNIKVLLRKRGELPEPGSRGRRRRKPASKKVERERNVPPFLKKRRTSR